MEGYAIYSATLGPQGSERFGVERLNFNAQTGRYSGFNEVVTILVSLNSDNDSPLWGDGEAVDLDLVHELDVSTAETVGAINLSELRWGAKWPEGRWLLDGDEESCIDGPDEIFVPNESEA